MEPFERSDSATIRHGVRVVFFGLNTSLTSA